MIKRLADSISWRFGRAKSRWTGYPRNLHIETTSQCNLNCAYCMLREKFPGRGMMSLGQFEHLRPCFRHAEGVSLSGIAEPLLNRDLGRCIEIVKEENPDCSVSIFTNATLLDEKRAGEMMEAGLDMLAFSLDGTAGENVDPFRRPGGFDKALHNIRVLNEKKVRKGTPGPRLCATMVLHQANYGLLPEVVELAAELGVETLDVNGLEPYSEDMRDAPLWTPGSMPDDFLPLLEAAAKAAGRLPVKVRITSMHPERPRCDEPLTPTVLPNGDVTPCAVLAYDRPSFFRVDGGLKVRGSAGTVGRRIFGNAMKSGLRAVVKSPEYREFSRKVLAGSFPPDCARCLVKHKLICVRSERSLDDEIALLGQGRGEGLSGLGL
jgi:MoaA/NifB/PqqE/SkfB family radical SAM enzyme